MIDLDAADCRRCDPNLFHPAPTDDRTIERAQRVCSRCAIRLDCLAIALTTPAAQGIWGGLTETERAAHRRQHLDDQHFGAT